MLVRSFELPNLPLQASMLSTRIASLLCTCQFGASNYPIFRPRTVCYLHVLPVSYVHASSELRTTQSSSPGQYATYTHCQQAMYILVRSFELPNLPPQDSMLSTRIASKLCTCQFGASNYPIFHPRPVCYLHALSVSYVLASSELRTTQSSSPGQYAIYTHCQ